jgi:outer membrane immunogenic protein
VSGQQQSKRNGAGTAFGLARGSEWRNMFVSIESFAFRILEGGMFMKRRFIGSFAVLGLLLATTLGAAQAADMPLKAPPPVPMPTWSWTGFYIGADVGGDWSRDNVSPTIADGGTFPRANILKSSGVMGAGTAGYNFQSGVIVYGIEGDLGYLTIRRSQADLLGGTEVDFIGGSGLYGDITGRFGLAIDRALVYVKGGYAYYNGSVMTTTAIPGFTVASANFNSGWTVGVGVEYKITQDWSVKGEYLHFDFGSKIATLTSGAGVFGYTNALSVDTFKVGVNYRFNWGGPVIAKY